jgi:hypothetical protein
MLAYLAETAAQKVGVTAPRKVVLSASESVLPAGDIILGRREADLSRKEFSSGAPRKIRFAEI